MGKQTLLAVIAAIALAVGGCSSAAPSFTVSSSSATSPVSLGHVSVHPSPVTATHSPPSLEAMRLGPRCRPSQLSASVVFTPAGMATDFYRITIRDDAAPCSLRGRPRGLIGVEASGETRVLNPGAVTKKSGLFGAAIRRAPANLNATHGADVLLVTGVACQKAQRDSAQRRPSFTSLRLGIGRHLISVRFDGGPELSDTGISFPCGVSMSGFRASYVATQRTAECRTADLGVAYYGTEPGVGSDFGGFLVWNRSPSACRLGGHGTITPVVAGRNEPALRFRLMQRLVLSADSHRPVSGHPSRHHVVASFGMSGEYRDGPGPGGICTRRHEVIPTGWLFDDGDVRLSIRNGPVEPWSDLPDGRHPNGIGGGPQPIESCGHGFDIVYSGQYG